MAKLTFYGGAGTIGGNNTLLEDRDTALFLDFGMDFKRYGLFFEEFLQPRSSRGIADLLALDILPELPGIYRDDLFPPGCSPPAGKPIHIDAVLLTHAHLDHAGHAGLLDCRIPFVSSAMTAVILKAMQDCGISTFDREIACTATCECTVCTGARRARHRVAGADQVRLGNQWRGDHGTQTRRLTRYRQALL